MVFILHSSFWNSYLLTLVVLVIEVSLSTNSAVAFVPSAIGCKQLQQIPLFQLSSTASSWSPTIAADHIVSPSLRSTASTILLSENNNIIEQWNNFQNNHTLLQGILLTIVIRLIIGEIRNRIEKPVLDKAKEKISETAKEQLTPDTQQITPTDWLKLGSCIVLDVGGDLSETLPIVGELTDVVYAPLEATLLGGLFQSPIISAFGFFEEILPFTDVIPTFTLSWILSTLFPTTPLAKSLLPSSKK